MRLLTRLALTGRRWPQWIPLVQSLKDYTRADFSSDLSAGVVVGMVTVPQAVAYAYLAGLPPQAGLYACLLPMLIYACLGSSRHLVVGPVAVAALLVAAAIAQHAPDYGNAHLAISSVLCLQVGLILLALNLFRMGSLVTLLSHPVITGFVNAAALLIIVSQLPAITGISIDQTSSPLIQMSALLKSVDELNATTLTIGFTALLFLLFSKTLIQRLLTLVRLSGNDHPLTKTGPLWAALAGILCVSTLGLSGAT